MSDLQLVMANDERNRLQLWACRGEGKGCKRNKYRTTKKPCDDCVGPLPRNMTLEQVQKKLEQGDA